MAIRMKDSVFFLGMKKAEHPKEFLQYLRDKVRERATLELGGGSTMMITPMDTIYLIILHHQIQYYRKCGLNAKT